MPRPINIRGDEKETLVTSTTQSQLLGTRMIVQGGRVFRYARAGASALAVATLAKPGEPTTGYSNLSIAARVEAGSLSLTATLQYRATTLNQFADGFVYVNDADGEGQLYEVVENSATAKEGTLTIKVNTPLQVALTTSSQVTLFPHRLSALQRTNLATNEQAAGVVPVAVAANSYFWLQTYGPAVCLQEGGLKSDQAVAPSMKTKGAVALATTPIAVGTANDDLAFGTGTAVVLDSEFNEREVQVQVLPGLVQNNAVGYALDPRVSTEHCLIYLSLDN